MDINWDIQGSATYTTEADNDGQVTPTKSLKIAAGTGELRFSNITAGAIHNCRIEAWIKHTRGSAVDTAPVYLKLRDQDNSLVIANPPKAYLMAITRQNSNLDDDTFDVSIIRSYPSKVSTLASDSIAVTAGRGGHLQKWRFTVISPTSLVCILTAEHWNGTGYDIVCTAQDTDLSLSPAGYAGFNYQNDAALEVRVDDVNIYLR